MPPSQLEASRVIFVCAVAECGSTTEAEEGWETVQRTNKTKSRPSPTTTSGAPPAARTTGPPAGRQADGDGRRSVTQPRCSERRSQGNVTAVASRQTDVNKQYQQQQIQQCSVDVNGNSRSGSVVPNTNNVVSNTAAAQQSKSTSHIGSRSGGAGTEHGVKSSPRPTHHQPPPAAAAAASSSACNGESHGRSETCLTTAADAATDSRLQCETDMQGSGDRRLITGCDSNAAESPRLTDGLCNRVTRDKPSVMDVTSATLGVTADKPSVGVAATHSVSMTEVRHSDIVADTPQYSSADNTDIRRSHHLCRKSLSEDTLVERLTVSGLCSAATLFTAVCV